MAGNRTFAMIKPDAFEAGKSGRILAQIEDAGYRIRALRLVRLTRVEAEAFYEVHRGRPFFEELVSFMSSGCAIAISLEKENAVVAWRATIGATDPAEAAPGTIRKLFAESKGRNAVHGSDSDENAAREIAFFFPERELARLASG
jgi:nucleoside-diphosphate kinase